MGNVNAPFSKAPIVEAVVDIDAEMRPGFTLAAPLHEFEAAVEDQYPIKQRREFAAHTLQLLPGSAGPVTSEHGVEALQYLQSDKKQLIQARLLAPRQRTSFPLS